MDKLVSLYRHFDKDGVLLYIGVTNNLGFRNKSHKTYAKWHDESHSITSEIFKNRELALWAEKEAIINEKPKYNRTHAIKEIKSPEKRSDYIYIKIGRDVKKRIKERAKIEGVNMTIYVRQLIMRNINEHS